MNKQCSLYGFCSLPNCNTDCKTYAEEKALLAYYKEEPCQDCHRRGCLCGQIAQEALDKQAREAHAIHDAIQRSLIDTRG